MKKMFLLCGLVIVFFTGCLAGGSPKAAVEKFYKGLETNDTKAIAEVTTPETAELLKLFGPMIQSQIKKDGKFKIGSEKIDGDTAVVTLLYESGEESNVDLVKVDGKWKIALKK
jgi:outer membrane lipoprotein-sorting protein